MLVVVQILTTTVLTTTLNIRVVVHRLKAQVAAQAQQQITTHRAAVAMPQKFIMAQMVARQAVQVPKGVVQHQLLTLIQVAHVAIAHRRIRQTTAAVSAVHTQHQAAIAAAAIIAVVVVATLTVAQAIHHRAVRHHRAVAQAVALHRAAVEAAPLVGRGSTYF